ncbi:MAG: antitoxin [Aeromicrobium sp.]|nr:antitoxin [Aeromicrobium sp.]
MGVFDNLMKRAPELKGKAADLAASHSDKIDQGIGKAAGLASKATKGKHDDKIADAARKIKDAADKLAENGKK